MLLAPEFQPNDAAKTAAHERETLETQRVGDRKHVVGEPGARNQRRVQIGLARSVAAQLDRRTA